MRNLHALKSGGKGRGVEEKRTQEKTSLFRGLGLTKSPNTMFKPQHASLLFLLGHVASLQCTMTYLRLFTENKRRELLTLRN